MTTTFLISGSSGLLGSQLINDLVSQGHSVLPVLRKRNPSQNHFYIELENIKISDPLPEGKLVWINLNGAGIADQRWTTMRKKELFKSRVDTTKKIAELLKFQDRALDVYIGASAIGAYGLTGSNNSFLQDICIEWEKAHLEVPAIQKVMVRIPVILSSQGGALSKMKLPFSLGAGGPIGSGQQKFPWIHIEDLSAFIISQINHKIDATSPETQILSPHPPEMISQKNFAKVLGSVMKRPAFAPLPGFVVNLLFGQMGMEALLGDPDYSPADLTQDYPWKYASVREALQACLRN